MLSALSISDTAEDRGVRDSNSRAPTRIACRCNFMAKARFNKILKEDMIFARRTEEAFRLYEKGKLRKMDFDEFLREVKKTVKASFRHAFKKTVVIIK